MNRFLAGFCDELEKNAMIGRALKGVGRLAIKHPLLTLGAAGTAIATGSAAASAYKQGLRGGEKPRYLAAGIDPGSGQAGASEAAYTNFNNAFDRRATPQEIKALSKHYDERKFKR